MERSINRLPERKSLWEQMLSSCNPDVRPGLVYLLEYLPLADLNAMNPDKLCTNAKLAYQTRSEVPWGKDVPEAIFLDNILPYFSLSEPRQPMRGEFHDRYLPQLKNYKTSGEAALYLNYMLFSDYHVKYDTRRLRNDQSAKETIEQGMATCTGLSIMLVEACRAVGIPARLAGIASLPNGRGNHTWVEVWDNGWHYLDANEPNTKGLDHTWFTPMASKLVIGPHQKGIYAVSYRSTGYYFPAAWDDLSHRPGEDVTTRYLHPTLPSPTVEK